METTVKKICILGERNSQKNIGLGRFATEIKNVFESLNIEYFFMGGKLLEELKEKSELAKNIFDEVSAVIYLEKDGKRYAEIMCFCNIYDIPLINLSTGINRRTSQAITFIDAPNIDIGILRKIKVFKMNTEGFRDNPEKYEAYITEAHQSGKKSVPGTAKVLQEILGVICHPQIGSIRSPYMAKLMGVPEYDLSGFGLHLVEIYEKESNENGVRRRVFKEEFYVSGRDSYVKGLVLLLDIIPSLEKRYYHINEIVEEGLL